MSIRTGVVVAVTFQQVDDTPDAETSAQSDNEGLKNGDRVRCPHGCPMKRFVKCFFELLTQILVKARKCKVQRVCVLHFQLAGSGGCFFLMKLYH